MRIIAGKWRGRALVAPPGDATRPTADRTREALFSMLASRLGDFEGLRVADLFAGTGALGLEALSRGAAHCTFVEQDGKALDALRANIAKLGATARRARAIGRGARPGRRALRSAAARSALWQRRRRRAARTARPPRLDRARRLGQHRDRAAPKATSAGGWTVDAERVHGKAKLTILRRDA